MIHARRVWRALTRNRAATDPHAPDPRLRGRTYAIPFDRVWQAARDVAEGDMKRWTVTRADDEAGVLLAEARTPLFGFVDDVRMEIGLDANAQTRVDVTSASRKGTADLGTNARRIGRFLRALDGRLGAGPEQVLEGRVELRYPS